MYMYKNICNNESTLGAEDADGIVSHRMYKVHVHATSRFNQLGGDGTEGKLLHQTYMYVTVQ
jgi:hypothetical protein